MWLARSAIEPSAAGLQQVERPGPRTSPTMMRSGRIRAAATSLHGDPAPALDAGRLGFQPHHMRLLQLKPGGGFAGDDRLP
jgi:hypothetical protein